MASGKAVTKGMVDLWEKTLDEVTGGVMSQVSMIRARNEVLARHEVERQLGIDKLRQKLDEGKRVVTKIEDALHNLGVEVSEYDHRAPEEAKSRLRKMVTRKAAELDDPSVSAFLATVQQAREQVRLACLPNEVRGILQEVRNTMDKLAPKITLIEERSSKLRLPMTSGE